MRLTMHATSVPAFVRVFTNMLNWLDKAQAHAEARKFDTANYLGLRLAPDMLPLTRQIQIATDGAKGCVARLAGQEILLPTRAGEPLRYTGENYLKQFVLPNLYFHATTTYALLRNASVEIGKRDFLG